MSTQKLTAIKEAFAKAKRGSTALPPHVSWLLQNMIDLLEDQQQRIDALERLPDEFVGMPELEEIRFTLPGNAQVQQCGIDWAIGAKV